MWISTCLPATDLSRERTAELLHTPKGHRRPAASRQGNEVANRPPSTSFCASTSIAHCVDLLVFLGGCRAWLTNLAVPPHQLDGSMWTHAYPIHHRLDIASMPSCTVYCYVRVPDNLPCNICLVAHTTTPSVLIPCVLCQNGSQVHLFTLSTAKRRIRESILAGMLTTALRTGDWLGTRTRAT